MLTDQQYIEIFHLVFLRSLKNNLDSSLYSIKGGCNLRFFFNSIRYSEDIDFDISVISKETLKKKIDTILTGSPLKQSLSHYDLEIAQVSCPKQTSTVQRWKVGIKAKNKVMPIPTKIEFSRRKMETQRKAESVGSFILQDYQLPPMILPHYLYSAAVKQKIDALIFRTQTQARDIFDLNLLFSRKDETIFPVDFDMEKAIDCILSISYADYSSQVVSYLMQEYVEHYKSLKLWEEIQFNVIENLKKYHHNETN